MKHDELRKRKIYVNITYEQNILHIISNQAVILTSVKKFDLLKAINKKSTDNG